jgi:uncharacterized membrane protein
MNPMSCLEQAKGFDRLTARLQRAVRLVPRGRVRDALHGVWLGHPLHPVLVHLPVGTWLSASLLDAWPGFAKASRQLVLAGLAASVPAMPAGAADWSEQHEQQMRVGLVHALANAAAIALYAASAVTPARPAKGLRLAGLATAGAGGFLGGHLAYRQSAGANQAEPVPHLVEPGWHDLMPLTELRGLHDTSRWSWCATATATPCTSWLTGAATCPGRCPTVTTTTAATCPWHGSTFRVADGAVARGPAAAPQPAFRTRAANGVLQACLPGAG